MNSTKLVVDDDDSANEIALELSVDELSRLQKSHAPAHSHIRTSFGQGARLRSVSDKSVESKARSTDVYFFRTVAQCWSLCSTRVLCPGEIRTRITRGLAARNTVGCDRWVAGQKLYSSLIFMDNGGSNDGQDDQVCQGSIWYLLEPLASSIMLHQIHQHDY